MKSQLILIFLLLLSSMAVSLILPRSEALGGFTNPYKLSLGHQTFVLPTQTYTYMSFHGSAGMMYQFSIDSAEMYWVHTFENDSGPLNSLRDFTTLPANSLAFGKSDYVIEFDQFGNAGKVSVDITELPIPTGATPFDAYSVSIGNSNGQIPYTNLPIYYKLTTMIGQWYQIQLIPTSSFAYVTLEQNSTSKYRGVSGYGTLNEPFQATQAATSIKISSESSTTQFLMIIQQFGDPPHHSIDTATIANLGSNTGQIYEPNVDFYLNLTTSIGQWYGLSLSMPQETNFDISYLQDSQYGKYYAHSSQIANPQVTVFQANLTITTLVIQSNGDMGHFTLNITTVTPPTHTDEVEAQIAVLGDNAGQLQYQDYGYYFNLTTTINQWYELSLTAPPNSDFEISYLISLGFGNVAYNYCQLSSSVRKTAFQASLSQTFIAITAGNSTLGPFTLSIKEIASLNHTYDSNAQPAVLGSNNGTTSYDDIPEFFRLTTIPDHWYDLDVLELKDSSVQISYTSNPTYIQSWISSNSDSLLFKASDTTYYISVLISRNPGTFDLNISEFPSSPHDTSVAAASFSVGSNNGSTPQPGIPFYFTFHTDLNQAYRFNISIVDSQQSLDYTMHPVSALRFESSTYKLNGVEYLRGDGTPIVVKVTSTSVVGDFVVNIEKISTSPNHSFATATPVSEGISSYHYSYGALSQYYSFNADPTSYYLVETQSDSVTPLQVLLLNANDTTQITGFGDSLSTAIITGQSRYYFQVLFAQDNLNFEIHIHKIDFPKKLEFGQLHIGDTSSWHIATTTAPEFRDLLSFFNIPVVNGSVSMDVKTDQPIIQRSRTYWGNELFDNISMTLNAFSTLYISLVNFILPTAVTGDNTINITDYLLNSGFFGSNVQVDTTSNYYQVSSVFNLLFPFVAKWTFDKSTGLLLNQKMSVVVEGQLYFNQTIEMTSTSLMSGTTTTDISSSSSSLSQSQSPLSTTSKKSSLIWHYWTIILGVMVIPVVKKRRWE